MKRLKVVVLGGSGFLGSHLCDELTQLGHDVTLFDVIPSPHLKPSQKMVLGDILDPDQVANAVQGCHIVYNLAGLADLEKASDKPIEAAQSNIIGNLNVLEACRNNPSLIRYLYSSSVYVYSESGGFYRCSKQASELFIEEYNRKYDLPFTILRYGTLFGPRAGGDNSVYRYLKQAYETGEITFRGNGEEYREYLHVRDAARLSAEVLEEKYKDARLVITGHQGLRVKDMFLMMFEILRKPPKINYLEKSQDHYSITPYSFVPKVGHKLVTNCFTDIGQGLIESLTDLLASPENKK